VEWPNTSEAAQPVGLRYFKQRRQQ
jgi:hypothetical protein